jgi:uncharacterized protein
LSQSDLIQTLKQIKHRYALPELYLFGSYAKQTNHEKSDIDIAVKLEKTDAFLLIRIMKELQETLSRKVDIVQLRERMNPFLKKTILEEGIRV